MRSRAYLYFVLTFLLGIVIGGAGVFLYGWHSGHWRRHFHKGDIVRHLTRELKLSPQQVSQLDEIIADYEKGRAELQKQFEPQFADLREKNQNRVRQILNPKQLAKFNEMVRRWNERMARRHPH